ncbi:Site-specific recombinase XerD [Balnearium lithotrophicum]|uniref:Site-specific recombinase XerD n=1 Tax=Balnearium lithotrophicum TaxID=223788 RepID=A0A521DWG6_9BACT|nr:tyrosine-type recombinase/integrase [Balnearium lithotrophicum]SMO76047.1 Site-specific recombinase XerD [Balnearium lithotrophicum]
MARIFKRGKYWWVDYRLPDGRRIRRSTGFTDKKMAELMLKDIELQIARKTLKIPVGIPLKEFWEKYSEYAKAHKTEQTWKTEKSVFSAFLSFLLRKGVSRLDKLNPEHLEKYKLLLIERGLSRFTVNKQLRTIKSIVSKAVEWELLPENPFKKVKLLKQPEGKLRFLTKEEIKQFLDSIDREDVKLYAIVALNTGLRLSELVNLDWEDVDLKHRLLRVTNKEEFTTKNYRDRTIPLNKTAYKAFKRLKELNPDKPITVKRIHLSKLISRYAKKAGLTDVTCHTLRHTFASHLAMNGVDLVTLKKLMGHSTINTTLIYTKITEEHKMKALSNLELTPNVEI